MAHQDIDQAAAAAGAPAAATATTDAIDTAAAAAAAELPAEVPAEEAPAPSYPTLRVGSQGASVLRLTNLLVYTGHASPTTRGKDVFDEEVLHDVGGAQVGLGVGPADLHGELVGDETWAALYEAAGAKHAALQGG